MIAVIATAHTADYCTILHLQDRARGHSMSTCTNPAQISNTQENPRGLQPFHKYIMKPISIEIIYSNEGVPEYIGVPRETNI